MEKQNSQRNKKSIKRSIKDSILILNASPAGRLGNGTQFIKYHWPADVPFELLHLADVRMNEKLFKKVLSAPAVVFVTGTYWDSWGSPLQTFLEAFTNYEGHPQIVGKPVACLVLMHSVGGKSVLSRLQGVLNTFGFLIPPMSGMVYSLVNKLSAKTKSDHAKDFWQPQDLLAIVHNLQTATEAAKSTCWCTWPVDKKNPRRTWVE
jgi:NAD(P)H-dependent FMN reductase